MPAAPSDPAAPPCPPEPPAPAWQMTLADSELADSTLHPDGQTLTLRLAAAHLRHPASGERGHARGLRLVLTEVRLQGQPLPGRLRDGRLWLGEGWQPGCAVPGRWQGLPGQPLRLEWEGAWGDRVQVVAGSLSAGFDGQADSPPAWQPWLHC